MQVFVRVRPHNEEELKLGESGPAHHGDVQPLQDPCPTTHAPSFHAGDNESCVNVNGVRSLVCYQPGREPKQFIFDQILYQGPQEEVRSRTACMS